MASPASPAVATVTPFGHNACRKLRIKDDHLARVLEGVDHLLFDGAMGTQLQERGLAAGEIPELLCLTNPDEITQIHAAYVAAGSEAVTTNTFGANRTKLGDAATVDQIFSAAVSCARASALVTWQPTSVRPARCCNLWAPSPLTTPMTSLPSR